MPARWPRWRSAACMAAPASSCRPALLFPLMMLAAALAGALLLLGPALMKSRLGVDEVVTTLLLNFIVLLGVSALLDGPMKDPTAMGWPQSVALQAELELGKLVERRRACTPACCGPPRWRVALWALLQVHRARLRHPRRRRQRARRRLRRRAGHAHRGAGGAAVRRAGRAGRRHRGGGPHRLRHARHVARLRLQRHRDRDAGRPAPAGRGGGGACSWPACWSAPTA